MRIFKIGNQKKEKYISFYFVEFLHFYENAIVQYILQTHFYFNVILFCCVQNSGVKTKVQIALTVIKYVIDAAWPGFLHISQQYSRQLPHKRYSSWIIVAGELDLFVYTPYIQIVEFFDVYWRLGIVIVTLNGCIVFAG